MFSKTRRTLYGKRCRKNRLSTHLSIESLERREMFAADLGANMQLLFEVNLNIAPQPAAIVARTTPTIGTLPVNLPTLGATFEHGVLTVTGSSSADHIHIYASEGTVYVREVVKQLTLLTVPATALTSIVVNAHGGDDWVNVDHETINVPATLTGGSGNDTLQGGGAADNLDGDSGQDKLAGYGGDDSIRGGDDDDLLIGGDGHDNLSGNQGNDYVLGGDGNDWLYGDDGNDLLFGEDGDDFLFGGTGQNLLDGGAGNDALYGGDDSDDIYGGDGHDFIMGLSGDDRIRGEGGNDSILAGDGNDIVDGGAGNDVIRGEEGNDAISGGAGNDTIYGGGDHDWLDGGAGDDVLSGEAGNDWLQGSSGVDLLNGGAGDDKLYQDRPEGAQPTGQVASAASVWDDVVGAGEDLGGALEDGWNQAVDVLADVAEWTLDRAELIGGLVTEWIVQLDDRVLRLGNDLATALSNWPWEAEFWTGLGRVYIDYLEILGYGEAFELFFSIVMPWQRAMTDAEIDLAVSVFGASINYHLVRMNEYSLVVSATGRAYVTGYIINSWGDLDDYTMIHELTHVWQYMQDGAVYIPEALAGQQGAGYEYGGVNELRAKMNAGQGLSAFNLEQQGDIVADYFDLRQQARAYETTGYAPQWLRDDLDVYIHFVKEVSTLTAAQLDTPDPPQSPLVGIAMTLITTADRNRDNLVAQMNSAVFQENVSLPLTSPATPVLSGANQNTRPAGETVFAPLSPTPTVKTTTASDPLENLASGPAASSSQTSGLHLSNSTGGGKATKAGRSR